jgi:RNA polymerase sigma factor (TIGR02999 family)
MHGPGRSRGTDDGRHNVGEAYADGQLTELLERWRQGDDDAFAAVVPHFYKRLRALAESMMRGERRDHTLQATALVHESYLRLVQLRDQHWDNRRQFFTRCAFLMRNILVDHARRRAALRHGGDKVFVALNDSLDGARDPIERALDVDRALSELAKIDEHLADLVSLRSFAGLTIEETAAVLGISTAKVKRDWALARAWLQHHLEQSVEE